MSHSEFDPASIFQGTDIRVEYAEEIGNGIQLPKGRLLSDLELARLAGAVDGSTVFVSLEVKRIVIGDRFEKATAIVLRAKHSEYFNGRTERHLYILEDGEIAVVTVFNENFSIRPMWREKGIGKLALAHQIKTAIAIGVKTIVANAVGYEGSEYTGYRAWPYLGYDGIVPADIWKRFPEKAVSALGFQLSEPPLISSLYRTKQGKALWKTFGSGFPMQIDVNSLNESCIELLARIER